MDVRYEGDRANEQDLKLTDAVTEISSSTNFMGRLQTLLAWHQTHPVDESERLRNDLIFQNYQGNRNPFIDHPEWVALIFNSDAPVITNQPQSLAVRPGDTATLAVGASGAGPLGYQWRFNGTNIDAALTELFTITNVQSSNVGSYSVLVSNSVGRVISASATLSLKPSIAGLIPITSDTLTENFDSMGPSGTNTPAGWYVGTGTGAISGTTVTVGTGSSRTGANYNFGSSGSADRSLGSLASNSTERDTEGRFINDTGSFIISFTISYTGEQWRVGGTNSVNNDLVMEYGTDGTNFIAMGPQFDFNTPVDSGPEGPLDGNNAVNRLTGIGGTYVPAQPVAPGQIFYLRWADADSPSFDHAVAIDDLAMTFTFSNPPPSIVMQPQSLMVNAGGTATFSVLASGNGDLSYQWTFNATNLISGATNSFLTLTNVQISETGAYAVFVSNGSATTSSNAMLTVNRVPVALPDAFVRLPDSPFTIRIADLLTNDFDLDGDALTIIGLSETSANGALVDRDTTYIYYTPPATNADLADQFTYTISDGRGGVSSATVTIRFAQPLNLAGFIGSEGFTVVSTQGVANVTYLLQATTNLATPTSWETIATNLAVTNGLIQFVDPRATDIPAQYYRVSMPW